MSSKKPRKSNESCTRCGQGPLHFVYRRGAEIILCGKCVRAEQTTLFPKGKTD